MRIILTTILSILFLLSSITYAQNIITSQIFDVTSENKQFYYKVLPYYCDNNSKEIITSGKSMGNDPQPRLINIQLNLSFNDYRIGDVIVFREVGTTLVHHRIIFKDEYRILTKGDNNSYIDKFIYQDDIIGRDCIILTS